LGGSRGVSSATLEQLYETVDLAKHPRDPSTAEGTGRFRSPDPMEAESAAGLQRNLEIRHLVAEVEKLDPLSHAGGDRRVITGGLHKFDDDAVEVDEGNDTTLDPVDCPLGIGLHLLDGADAEADMVEAHPVAEEVTLDHG
jgi:hypothetical protein